MGPDTQTDKWDVGTARLGASFWLIFARPMKVPAVQTVDVIYEIEKKMFLVWMQSTACVFIADSSCYFA